MAGKLGILLLALMLSLAQPASARRKLLLFLLDGFRADYISDEALESLPGFKEIVSRGVKVDYLTPDFPSLSYPNYYSLMTGRHCEVHHMTENYMWDSDTNKSFNIGINRDSRLPLWWNGSEPLWVTLTKAKRKVYMYYWPGCEVEILGVRPTYCLEYKSVPTDANFANAVSGALDVFKSGQADLAAIYYERVDVEGHHHGPWSPQRKDAVKAVDTVMAYLTKWIQERELQDDLNVIIFSDHGMTDISWIDKVIELYNYINLRDLQQVKGRGPIMSLWPAPGKHSENRESLPFWMNSSITRKAEGWQWGWHGYDNELRTMRGIFLAFGPDFKSDFRAAPIRVVDIYNLMCRVTGVTPLPNNGSWSRVMCMLKDPASSAPGAPPSASALVTVLVVLLVMLA
ncbi:hypothetical protein G4228_018304 [Cervus hanglu yarkandensis]|nr:hypothetical protein G4228_018304 [Cervus hanglu yarkandensis]